MLDVTILLLNQGHASTSVGPIEVFHSAGRLWDVFSGKAPHFLFNVRTASQTADPVQPDGPYRLVADCVIDDVEASDLIFVPSAGLGLERVITENRPVIDWLRARHRAGAMVAGVCAGLPILAEAGVLDGRQATTHWGLVEEYRARYPRVDWRPECIVTECDGVFTGAGVYAALDLSLYLVEKFCGRAHAVQTAKSLLINMPRTSQTGFALMPVGAAHTDSAIRRAEEHIQANFAGEVNFEDLAKELGMSPRNFIRRFKEATAETPSCYLQKTRVAAAREMLESGRATVQEVASHAGYADLAFFRDVFRRHTGLSPTEYRERFSRNRGAA